ncbi:MAG: 4-hydroxy-tetrahydrodipicolinate reductase [Candidatus Omnitrophica bacterium]|nr:4-hydroxy-tetrahydrodipicolinate reductase [Candidatus Omnitrophota bacterium]
MLIPLVISGCCGRMGLRIASLALADGGFKIVGALEHAGHLQLGRDLSAALGGEPLGMAVTDLAEKAIRAGRVVIEFTTPEATVTHAELAQRAGAGMVIGTTGLTPSQRDQIEAAARKIPIVFSPNMSVGVNVLFELAELAARRLDAGYDIEIVEAHHKAKKDAPSGTAKRLAESVASGRDAAAHTIPVHAVRAGDIVGDHTVIFAGPCERLELTHRAHSRDAFAVGALRAARFVHGRRPGLYTMAEVLRGEGGKMAVPKSDSPKK